MTYPNIPLCGITLVLGPSQVGKTRLTANTLTRWLDERGPEGVIVFEFAPEVVHEGQLLGGRLTRFLDIPSRVWVGTLDAHAPRVEGRTIDESIELACANAERAIELLTAAPDDPRAVFVNDATIPFQHEKGDVTYLTTYCDQAECVVMNMLETNELGVTDPISRRERAISATLQQWADRTVSLD